MEEFQNKVMDFAEIFGDDAENIGLEEDKEFWEARHELWFNTLKTHGFSEEEVESLEIFFDSTDLVYGSLMDDLESEVSEETMNKFMKLDLSELKNQYQRQEGKN